MAFKLASGIKKHSLYSPSYSNLYDGHFCKNCNTRFGIVLSISYDIVSSKIYDKRGDFDFGIVKCPFSDGDVA